MAYTTLTLAVKDAIAHVTLNRPEALNTMTPDFWEEMISVFEEIDALSEVRCVIICSTGKHFTAGLDLNSFASLQDSSDLDLGRKREKFRRKVKRMQESFSVIDRCRMPVIAVVQGGCIGAGVDLVTACDMRIMTQDAYFTIQEINIAIVADVGTLQRMPDQIPPAIMRELAYTGRKFAADEAKHYGFVNAVGADQQAALDSAQALAEDIASKSPLAITGVKEMLNYSRDHSIADGLEYVVTWNAAMLQGSDPEKAIKAMMAKQKATFDDLG